jgi:hypothetical protein
VGAPDHHLQLGRTQDGHEIFSKAQADAMWAPQTIISNSGGPSAVEPGRSIFNTYALGWNVFDYRGERVIGHSGGMNGQITYTAMIPQRGVGITVLTNAEERGVNTGLRNSLLDRMMGASFDWLAYYRKADRTAKDEALQTLANDQAARPAGKPSLPLDAYAGTWRDPWYGDMIVSRQGAGLRIRMVKTPAFDGALEPWGGDVFVTRFTDPKVENAFVTFRIDGGRAVEATLKASSPLADFSYDFHHLDFTPVR